MRYRYKPQEWEDAPLEPELCGDVTGYDQLKTLANNPTPLVVPDVRCIRQQNNGVNIFGDPDPVRALPGAIAGGAFLVREPVARGLEYIERAMHEHFSEQYKLIFVEGYRSIETQKNGFARALQDFLDANKITTPNDNQLLEHGRRARWIFAWVRPGLGDPAFGRLRQELMEDREFVQALVPQVSNDDPAFTTLANGAVEDYIVISANSRRGRAAERGILLDSEHNAHAGGGAIDIMIADEHLAPLSHVPYPFSHSLSAMRFLEDDANFDVYKREALVNPHLNAHLERCGIGANQIRFEHWSRFRRANRVRLRAILAAGGTFYDGETWHFQLGRTVTKWNTNDVVAEEQHTSQYGASGGTAHTIITEPTGTAVWAGKSALNVLHKQGMA